MLPRLIGVASFVVGLALLAYAGGIDSIVIENLLVFDGIREIQQLMDALWSFDHPDRTEPVRGGALVIAPLVLLGSLVLLFGPNPRE